MDLMCVDRTTINWMVTIHYIAFGIGGFFLWWVPDKYGCRSTFSLFGTIHLIALWIMILVPNYWVRFSMFGVMGLAQLKTNVCYSWLFSLVHSSNKASVCSFLNAFDTITLAVSCFYFQFISREW
jgi:hypothetical protein